MSDLTLIIPAKNEKESLPKVLDELKGFDFKKNVILEASDRLTIEAIKTYDCKIIYQDSNGYGDALKKGIETVETEFFCIFNADGSFNPIELKNMENILESQNADIVFASRYEKDCGSDDDTIVTFIGNYIFTKIGQIFYFSIGDNCKMLDIANLIVNNNKKNPYALSMLSFALEESNQIHKAKEVALKAIEIYPSDPWAHHTLAHIFEVENKPEAGITTLEDFSYHWKNCNSFIYTHNWWHIALFYLRINKIDKVVPCLSVYSQELYSIHRNFFLSNILLYQSTYFGYNLEAKRIGLLREFDEVL